MLRSRASHICGRTFSRSSKIPPNQANANLMNHSNYRATRPGTQSDELGEARVDATHRVASHAAHAFTTIRPLPPVPGLRASGPLESRWLRRWL